MCVFLFCLNCLLLKSPEIAAFVDCKSKFLIVAVAIKALFLFLTSQRSIILVGYILVRSIIHGPNPYHNPMYRSSQVVLFILVKQNVCFLVAFVAFACLQPGGQRCKAKAGRGSRATLAREGWQGGKPTGCCWYRGYRAYRDEDRIL